MSAARLKGLLLLAGAAFAGLTLLAWTQPWFDIVLTDGIALSVTGEVAAPALTALALTGLVLVGSLSIAGPFFRVVLGSLQTLLGITVALNSVLAIVDPVGASGAAISEATGVAGVQRVDQVASFAVTLWPWLALLSGALLIAAGIAVVATSKRWPGSSRKYNTVRLAPADGTRTSVDDWDALSSGDDPTGDNPTGDASDDTAPAGDSAPRT